MEKKEEKEGWRFSLPPQVVVATQHINKRQVPAFRELEAHSLVGINSSLAANTSGMF